MSHIYCQTPENPALRPHNFPARIKEKVRSYLEDGNGLVIYVRYPAKEANTCELRPLTEATKVIEYPDTELWDESGRVLDEDGDFIVVQPPVRFGIDPVTKKKYKLVAIDTIIIDDEVDDVNQILETHFKWK